jgi:4-amino-4-deoxy-L-arabinose transferase-like glycosyltransferase
MMDVDVRHAVRDRGVERLVVPMFVGLSVVYALLTWVLARRKLMWNDELYTYYIARLPSMHDVWNALMSRGEQTPPFFFVITRLSFRLFGVNHVSIRLPEILAFWTMTVCLYVFVRRRMSAMSALCAAAFPLVTMAFPYAYEARPYGLVLGFAALALVSWQAAISAAGRARVLALVCLTASLAAAVSNHYYGVFVLMPLALGEAVRTVMRRRLDIVVWAALAISVVTLAWHLPLIKAGRAYSGAFWSPPQWVNVPDFYQDLLTPALLPIAAILTLAAMHHAVFGQGPSPSDDDERRTLPLHELAAIAGFLIIPLAIIVVAKLVTGAFVNRYAVAAVIGVSVLAGLATELAFRRRPAVRVLVAACLAGWFVLSQVRELVVPTSVSLPLSPVSVMRPAEWVAALGDRDLPFVAADPHTFIELSHYGAHGIASRLVYLADPDRALKVLGHNSVERGMVDLLQPWFHMNVVRFEPFVAEHARFLVYGNFVHKGFMNWLLPELRARGYHAELLNQSGDDMLLLASRELH